MKATFSYSYNKCISEYVFRYNDIINYTFDFQKYIVQVTLPPINTDIIISYSKLNYIIKIRIRK
jgi:hypothetical protein